MKNLIAIIFLCCSLLKIGAQNCQPQLDCGNAPLFCGFSLQGHVFNNAVPIIPGAFDPQCGPNFTTHNSNWFRIIPCSPNLMLTINVLTSSNGDGLQTALYSGCNSASTVACNPGQEFGAFIPLVLSTAVTPGQEYYLQIDGYSADICQYTITVNSGLNVAPPPAPIPPVDGIITSIPQGPVFCSISPAQFMVDWPGCANFQTPQLSCYEPKEDSCKGIKWTLPQGAVVLGDPYANPVTVDFHNVPPGMYTIKARPMDCACPQNVCPDCGQLCCPAKEVSMDIIITSPSLTILPNIEVCPADWPPACVLANGGTFNSNSATCIVSENPALCQATVQPYTLAVPVVTNLGTVAICENDTLHICDSTYTIPGTYLSICSCDSAVFLTVVKEISCYHDCLSYNFPAPPGDNCAAAPFFCGNYLEGYCSSNSGLTADTIQGAPVGNAGFLRLSPCEDSINLQIEVRNCQANGGLTFWLASGTCNDQTLVTTTTITNNQQGNLTAYNLEPDSTYFLVFTGFLGDVCEFSIPSVGGIGTATPGPVTCNCTNATIEGPAEICPADIVTYTLVPPQCTFTTGPGTGGNGYACCPGGGPSADSLHLIWHIPSFMDFVGDSVDIYTITVQIDSSLMGMSISETDTVWVSYEAITNTATDSLTFCDCTAAACAVGIDFLPVHIHHEVTQYSCELTCVVPSCTVDGQVFAAPGTYIIQTNCETKIITVTQNIQLPNLFIPPAGPLTCITPSVTLIAITDVPGGIIQWNGPSGPVFQGPVINVNTPGVYTCSVFNPANGCVNVASTFVNGDFTPPVASAGANQTICAGESATLQATSSKPVTSAYLWSTGQSAPSITVAPAVTTTYQVTVTDTSNGCTATAAVTVTVAPPQVIEMGEVGQISCTTPCFVFMGNPYCAPGNYEIIQNACTTLLFTIGIDPTPVPNVLPPILLCNGECYAFYGQSYCTSTTATHEENCVLFIQEIQVAPPLNITTSPSVNICPGETATLSATATGGFGNYVYQWSNGSVLPETAVTPAETTTYTVTVTDQNGCTQTAEVIVTINMVQVMEAGLVGHVSCNNPCFSFLGNNYCLPGQYSNEVNCVQTNFEIGFAKDTVNVGLAGTITCTQSCVSFQNQNFCQPGNYVVSDSCTVYLLAVAENLTPPACSTPSLDCLPGNNNYTVGFFITGTQPYKVNGAPIVGSYYLSEPISSGAQYNFIVEQTANGCQTLLTGNFNCGSMCAGEAASLASSGASACVGESITVSIQTPPQPAPGQVTMFYLHDNPGPALGTVLEKNQTGTFSFDPVTMNEDATYYITNAVGVTNAVGEIDFNDACTRISNGQPIVFHALPKFQEIVADPPACFNGSDGVIEVNSTGASPLQYALNTTAWASAHNFENLSAGAYTVHVRDANNCLADSLVTLLNPDSVWITLGTGQTIMKDESTTLVPQTNAQTPLFNWTNETSGEPFAGPQWTVKPDESSRFVCTVTDGSGCIALATLLVQVRPDGLFVPNVITPETDSPENQKFTLFAQEGYVHEIVSLEIFDRWGSAVFNRKSFLPNDPSLGWDGTCRGTLRSDVFIYVATVQIYDGSIKLVKGDVTVVR